MFDKKQGEGHINRDEYAYYMKSDLYNLSFEVFGKVQGVFFRKHTQAKAMYLKLVGWVENTSRGTVVGACQGPYERLHEMLQWLENVGYQSHINIEITSESDRKIRIEFFKDKQPNVRRI